MNTLVKSNLSEKNLNKKARRTLNSQEDLASSLDLAISSQQDAYDAWLRYCSRIVETNIQFNLSNRDDKRQFALQQSSSL